VIYEVRANLFFANPDEARGFYHDCELALDKTMVVNPDSPNSEHPFISLIESHHDEDPNGECRLLVSHSKYS